MLSLPLASVGALMKVAIAIWIISAVFLVLLVLVQKGRGGGLGAAFGGASNSLLGTKTGDFLTWVTIVTVVLWLFLSVVVARWYRPSQSALLSESVAASVPAPGGTVADVNLALAVPGANLPSR